MSPRSIALVSVFCASCAIWIGLLYATALAQFPTKQLVSHQCSGNKLAAERELIRLESRKNVDILLVGTPRFVSDVRRIIPKKRSISVASVAVRNPGPKQFASSSRIFSSKRPKVRIFQNAPYIWTDYSSAVVESRQSETLTTVTSRANRLVKPASIAMKHLNFIVELAADFKTECRKIPRDLPDKLYWSSFLPDDLLEERIDLFADGDKVSGRTEATFWVHDEAWIPSDTKPETRAGILEFYAQPDNERLGSFVELDALSDQLEAIFPPRQN